MLSATLTRGVGWALAAGLMWGFVFIAPAILHDYPPAILSVSRYLAFGLIALPLALASRRAIAALERADWIEAAKLSLAGNLLYYGFLAAAIQLAGPPLPTMIIGTLPVVIAVASNLAEPALPWRKLALSLAVIAAGILLVNRDELALLAASAGAAAGTGDAATAFATGHTTLLAGALLSVAGVTCWTWYPIRNAAWLRRRPGLRSDTWATAQGLTTLPLALIGWFALGAVAELAPHAPALSALATGSGESAFEWPLGPRPALFIGLMLAIGLFASWLGTLCWNRASQLLPTSLAGQLIVFETLSALAMGFSWRGQWPAPGTWIGIALLVTGVVLGVRAFTPRGAAAPPARTPAT